MDFHRYITLCCGHCQATIVVPVCCKDRFCPVCSHSRRARVQARLWQLVHFAHRASPLPLRFLTLTVQSCNDPATMASHLVAAFRRLRSSHWWLRHAIGGAYVLEVTRSAAGWHVHIHALVQGSFIPQHQLAAQWKRVSGSPVVWITKPDPRAVVLYLTKYLAKPSDSADNCADASMFLRSFRLFQPFGSWHNVGQSVATHCAPCHRCGSVAWYVLPVVARPYAFAAPRSPPLPTEA